MKAAAALLAAVLLQAQGAPLCAQAAAVFLSASAAGSSGVPAVQTVAAVVHAAPGAVVAAPALRAPVLSPALILPTGGILLEGSALPALKAVVPYARATAAHGLSVHAGSAVQTSFPAASAVSAEEKNAASPRSSLESVETSLAPARDADASPETRVSVVHRVFAGMRFYARDSAEAPEAVAVPEVSVPLEGLQSASRSETPDLAAPPAPRQSLARAVRYGFLMGLLAVAIKTAGFYAATALGYVAAPNYGSLVMDVAGTVSLSPLALMFHRSVYAPVWEELVFRCGLLGGLKKAGELVHLPGAAVLASVLSSAVFVLLHESADPLLIGLRMIESLLLSRAYLREGYAAAVAQHATINGLLTAVNLALTALAPGAALATLAGTALVVLAGLAASLPSVLSERGDRREGRIARYRLPPVVAIGLAVFLLVGTVVFIPYDLPKSLLAVMVLVHSAYNGWLDV